MPTRTPSNARFGALCAANQALPSPPSDAGVGVGADPFLSRIEDEARRNAVAALDLADRVQREGDIAVSSIPDGWLWAIPLSDGRMSVGAVVHRDSLKAQKELGMEAIYHQSIARGKMVNSSFAERTR